MHEFSLVQGLLNRVGDVAVEHRASRVKKIWLKVGQLSGAEPHLLREAFSLLSRDGIADGAQLNIEAPELLLGCRKCGTTPMSEYLTFVCNECGSALPIPDGSSDLLIERLELELVEEEVTSDV